jgi:hypothetical protein
VWVGHSCPTPLTSVIQKKREPSRLSPVSPPPSYQSRVIPNSFAEGEGERDLTLRLHQHQRKQVYVQRFHQTIQPARHSCFWETPSTAEARAAGHPVRIRYVYESDTPV